MIPSWVRESCLSVLPEKFIKTTCVQSPWAILTGSPPSEWVREMGRSDVHSSLGDFIPCLPLLRTTALALLIRRLMLWINSLPTGESCVGHDLYKRKCSFNIFRPCILQEALLFSPIVNISYREHLLVQKNRSLTVHRARETQEIFYFTSGPPTKTVVNHLGPTCLTCFTPTSAPHSRQLPKTRQ